MHDCLCKRIKHHMAATPAGKGPYTRATSHTRLRARDHYNTPSTLIGRKGGAGGPSSLLHTMLEGPTEYVCECKMDGKVLHGFLHGIEWIMSRDHLDYSQEPPLGGRSNTKIRRPQLFESSQLLVYSILSCVRNPQEETFSEITFSLRARSHMTSHYMIFGGVLGHPRTLSYGLSQFHDHGSWLVCEVAMSSL